MKKAKAVASQEQLRQKAKQTLLSGTASGKLDAALSSAKQKKAQAEAEALRQQAKATLLQASSSGKLDEALSDVRKATQENEIRQAAKDTLLSATMDGRLQSTLSNLRSSAPAPEPITESMFQEALDKPDTAGPAGTSGLSTPGISIDQLQQQIVSGLKEEIGSSVKNAVGSAVSEAVNELQLEMKKRSEQTAKMSEQMKELTDAVKCLKEKSQP